MVEECAAVGAGGAIVFASGYAETGKPEHVALQKRLSEIASESGVRIFGPNCIGWVNYLSGALVSFLPYTRIEAPRDSALEYLNRTLFIATAEREPSTAVIHFFRLL